MRRIIKVLYKFFSFMNRGIYKTAVMPFKRVLLKKCGRNCFIGRRSDLTYHNVSLGDNVSIGNDAIFISTNAEIRIGNNVMFGPHVFIITGDHRIDMVGRYMKDIRDGEKLPENDKDVVLAGDNWIGADSIILKGVTIGRGAVVAAGAVVVHDVPPYGIVSGIPARLIKMRFDEKNISEHEKILYSNSQPQRELKLYSERC